MEGKPYNNKDVKETANSSSVLFSQTFEVENKLKFIENLKEDSRIPRIEVDGDIKEAAVLIPFCLYQGEPSVLFTLRSKNLKRHKGEVCFPGGKRDQGDASFIDTALRETEEEVGIPRTSVDVWTTSLPVISRFFNVTPVYGFVGEVKLEDLRINPDEVDVVIIKSLSSLCDPKNWIEVESSFGFRMPGFLADDHKIWGLTAIILDLALSNLHPKVYLRDFALHVPPTILRHHI